MILPLTITTQVDGETGQTRVKISGNQELSIFFEDQPTMDGLTPETAYVFDSLRFTDEGNIGSYFDIQLDISDTNRFINITNCHFERYDEYKDWIFDGTRGIQLINCTNVFIDNCFFDYRRAVNIIDCVNITVQESELLGGYCNPSSSENVTIVNNYLHLDYTAVSNLVDYLLEDRFGISVSRCNNTLIANNTIVDIEYGIQCYARLNNVLICNNTLIRSRFEVIYSRYGMADIDRSNTVNGKKAVIEVLNSSIGSLNNAEIGQIFLFNCRNGIIQNANIEYLEKGIYMFECTNITIENCTVLYPIHIGIDIIGGDDLNFRNNSIFGWTYDFSKYKAHSGLGALGICFESSPFGKSENLNFTENIIAGCEVGLCLSKLIDDDENQVDDVKIWRNYFCKNAINAFCPNGKYVKEQGWVLWDNGTTGNYWDDHIWNRWNNWALPETSCIGGYNNNGVIDNHPLDQYFTAVWLPELNPLYIIPDSGLGLWSYVGIAAGAVIIVLTTVIIVKKKRLNLKSKDNS